MFIAKCDFLLCFTLRFWKCFFTFYVHNSLFILSLLARDKEIIFQNFRENSNNVSEIVIFGDKMEKCFARINYLNNNWIKLLFYVHYTWIIKWSCMMISGTRFILFVKVNFFIQDISKGLEQILSDVRAHCNEDFLHKTPGSKHVYFLKCTGVSDNPNFHSSSKQWWRYFWGIISRIFFSV